MSADTSPALNDQQRAEIIRVWNLRRRVLDRLRYAWAAVAIALIAVGVAFDALENPALVFAVLIPIAALFAFLRARFSRCPHCGQNPGPRVRFHAPKHVHRGADAVERWENCARCGVTLLDEATIAAFRARRFGSGPKTR